MVPRAVSAQATYKSLTFLGLGPCLVRGVITRIAKLRYVRIVGFAAGAAAIAGAAVLVTASAAGLNLGTRSASPQQAPVGTASIAEKSSPAQICDTFLTNLTKDLGKGLKKADVNAAIQKAIGETLAAEVTNGDITKAQADSIKAKLASQPTCALAGIGRTGSHGDRGRNGVYKQLIFSAEAAALNISEDKLKSELAAGKTVSQLAPTGTTEAQFRTLLISKLTPMLDKAITANQMTADQKTEILKRLQTGPVPFWSKPVHKPVAAPAATT
jgi:hypothetical protein